MEEEGDNTELWLTWNDHAQILRSVLATLRHQGLYADVTLVCGAKQYTVHRFILSTCSAYFEKLLETIPGHHPVVVLTNTSPKDLEALLDFMYLGQTEVSSNDLDRLLDIAFEFRIRGLISSKDDPGFHGFQVNDGNEYARTQEDSQDVEMSETKVPPSEMEEYRMPKDEEEYRMPEHEEEYRMPEHEEEYRMPEHEEEYRMPEHEEEYRMPDHEEEYRMPDQEDEYRMPEHEEDYGMQESEQYDPQIPKDELDMPEYTQNGTEEREAEILRMQKEQEAADMEQLQKEQEEEIQQLQMKFEEEFKPTALDNEEFKPAALDSGLKEYQNFIAKLSQQTDETELMEGPPVANPSPEKSTHTVKKIKHPDIKNRRGKAKEKMEKFKSDARKHKVKLGKIKSEGVREKMKTVEDNKTKIMMCPGCKKTFMSQSVLEDHMKTHADLEIVSCAKCPYKALSQQQMQKHMLSHQQRMEQKSRPYRCPYCPARQPDRSSFIQHQKTLHPDKKLLDDAMTVKVVLEDCKVKRPRQQKVLKDFVSS